MKIDLPSSFGNKRVILERVTFAFGKWRYTFLFSPRLNAQGDVSQSVLTPLKEGTMLRIRSGSKVLATVKVGQ